MTNKRDKIEKLVEKASIREEHFRRFDPKRTRYNGAQLRGVTTAYNKMRRALNQLERAENRESNR